MWLANPDRIKAGLISHLAVRLISLNRCHVLWNLVRKWNEAQCVLIFVLIFAAQYLFLFSWPIGMDLSWGNKFSGEENFQKAFKMINLRGCWEVGTWDDWVLCSQGQYAWVIIPSAQTKADHIISYSRQDTVENQRSSVSLEYQSKPASSWENRAVSLPYPNSICTDVPTQCKFIHSFDHWMQSVYHTLSWKSGSTELSGTFSWEIHSLLRVTEYK